MWQLALYTPHARNLKIQGMSNRLNKPLRPQFRELDENHERFLLAVLMETPTLYLHEMCKHAYLGHYWGSCIGSYYM